MNFKKFISGVSALTIAASAFAGLAVTASAETLYTQDYESGTVDWTTATGGRFTPVILEEEGNKYLSVNQDQRNNNGTTISSTAVSIDAETDYTLTFDFKISSSTNQTATKFSVYDKAGTGTVLSLAETGTWATTWTLNGGDSITLPNTNKGGGSNTIADVPWYTAVITSSGDKVYVTIADKATNTAIVDKKSVTGSAYNGIGKFEFITSRYLANFAIDNVIVRDVETSDLPTTPQGEFTVVYKTTDDATLDKTSSGSGDVGSAPVLAATDKADFTENGNKYTYVSDDSADVTIAEDNSTVVTVTVRALAEYSYSVVADQGNVTIASGTGFDGDTIKAAYPKYINVDGTLYERGAENKEYNHSFALDQDNKAVSLAYTATEINNVVFLTEGEDIAGLTASNAANTKIRSSKSGSAYAAADTTITTLPAGKYQIYAVIYSGSSGGANLEFTLGDNAFAFTNEGNSNWVDVNTEELIINEASDLVFKAGGGNAAALDFIYIVKTGNVEVETPSTVAAAVDTTVGDNGNFTVGDANSSVWNGTVGINGKTKVYAESILFGDTEAKKSNELSLDGIDTNDLLVYVVVNKLSSEIQSLRIIAE